MRKIYRYLLISVCVFVVIGICFSLVSLKSGEEFAKQQTETLAFINSVSIPESVEFCGKKISLDRYDMHERYDREINGFTQRRLEVRI